MMYSIFINDKPVKTFQNKSNADWYAYSLARRGIESTVCPAPAAPLCDILHDLEPMDLTPASFITINGAQVWA